MINAFISYSREDTPLLEEHLLPVLAELKITAQYDRDVKAGEFWLERVIKQIEESDWLIVFLTASYQDKIAQTETEDPCRLELQHIAKRLTNRARRVTIVPLRQWGAVPALIGTCQAIDLRTTYDKLKLELQQLLTAAAEATLEVESGLPDVLPRPPINDRTALRQLARYNFDRQAREYQRHVRFETTTVMQRDNALNLISMLEPHLPSNKKGLPSWLDAGCGTGLLGQVISLHVDRHKYKSVCKKLLGAKIRAAFDYAPRMVALAKQQNVGQYTHLFEADFVTLDSATVKAKLGYGDVDLLLANNVIHWLFEPAQIAEAFASAQKVVRGKGLFAASIAAVGTAGLFLEAYAEEMRHALKEGLRERDAANWQSHLSNPIGLQSLDGIVQIARKNGFKILTAQLSYEPVQYTTTWDYVSVARAYGEEVFMAPLLSWPTEKKDSLWQKIAERFNQIHQEHFHREGYEHDQYMIYLIAQCE
jgi:SAM-dependent methyltransferase